MRPLCPQATHAASTGHRRRRAGHPRRVGRPPTPRRQATHAASAGHPRRVGRPPTPRRQATHAASAGHPRRVSRPPTASGRPPARGGPTIHAPSTRPTTRSYIVGPPLAGGLPTLLACRRYWPADATGVDATGLPTLLACRRYWRGRRWPADATGVDAAGADATGLPTLLAWTPLAWTLLACRRYWRGRRWRGRRWPADTADWPAWQG